MNNKLYIFCGIPFSGKTTLSNAVANRTGYTRVALDEVKCDLRGENVRDLDLRQKDWDLIYQDMYKRIEKALREGKTVIHDAGNFTQYERGLIRQIADKLRVRTITIFVDTPKDIARERSLKNRLANQRFDVTDQEFEDAVAEMEAPDKDETHIIYKIGTAVDPWIAQHIA